MNGIRYLSLGLVAFGCVFSAPSFAKTIYKIDEVVPMKGKAPSWDYVSVDSSRDLLFLGRRAAGVTVYDVANKKELAKIEGSEGANAAVLVKDFDRGYTINGDGSTTIFTLSTFKTIDRVKIGESADNGFYDAATKQLVVTMGDDKLLTFVDAKTGKVNGTLKMEAEELEGAAPDGKGMLFLAERDINKVAKIDIAARKVVAEYPTTGCVQPTGVTMDGANNRLFLGCKSEKPVMLVLDATDGKVVATEIIGRGNDGIAYDADNKRVFATNGIDGNLVIYDQVSPDKYVLAQALTTRPIARTIALDPKSKKIFTMTAQGTVDPEKKRNMRAGSFYPNAFFDDTFTLLVIGPHETPINAAVK